MLVLSRKKNQSIVIDGGIEIQILQLKGGTVRLGIKAPNNVRIVRGELDLYSDMVEADQSEKSSEQVTLLAADERAHAAADNRVLESPLQYYAKGVSDRVLAK